MKNVILGIIGVYTTIYIMLICMNLYTLQTHQNQLNLRLSKAVQNALELGFETKDPDAVMNQLRIDLGDVQIDAMDLEMGLLKVTATDTFTYVTGKEKQIRLQKMAIIDRIDLED